jgi:hypothetical protein
MLLREFEISRNWKVKIQFMLQLKAALDGLNLWSLKLIFIV